MLGGAVFVFGATKRLVLSALFTLAWFYSLKYKATNVTEQITPADR